MDKPLVFLWRAEREYKGAGARTVFEPMSHRATTAQRHRRNKRIALLMGLLVLVVAGVLVAWWLPLILAVLLGGTKPWFADHLFYSPGLPVPQLCSRWPVGRCAPGRHLCAASAFGTGGR